MFLCFYQVLPSGVFVKSNWGMVSSLKKWTHPSLQGTVHSRLLDIDLVSLLRYSQVYITVFLNSVHDNLDY